MPFVALGDGTHIQVLHTDVDAGLWVVRTRFEPGVVIATHRHTGPVYAFTVAGRWKYAEYPEVNTAGSYLFEPAGSVHTLTVPTDNDGLTDVWFAVWGANLNLDEAGNVVDIVDARVIRDGYLALCEANGVARPDFIDAGGVGGR